MPKNSAYCGDSYNRQSEINVEHDLHVEELRRIKEKNKTGTGQRYITYHATTPEMRSLYGETKIIDCVEVFTKAHSEFLLLVEKFKGERSYADLFLDMIKNRKLWFSLFELDDNYVLAECCVGMLGNIKLGLHIRNTILFLATK